LLPKSEKKKSKWISGEAHIWGEIAEGKSSLTSTPFRPTRLDSSNSSSSFLSNETSQVLPLESVPVLLLSVEPKLGSDVVSTSGDGREVSTVGGGGRVGGRDESGELRRSEDVRISESGDVPLRPVRQNGVSSAPVGKFDPRSPAILRPSYRKKWKDNQSDEGLNGKAW